MDPHIILINAHVKAEEEEIKFFNYKVIKNNITNRVHNDAVIYIRRDLKFRKFENLQEILAVKSGLAQEVVEFSTGYCPFKRLGLTVTGF